MAFLIDGKKISSQIKDELKPKSIRNEEKKAQK